MYCYARAVNGLDFHGFSSIQCFGGKTRLKSYSRYGLLFGEIDLKNTMKSIGLESATSQHSNNFKNSKIGSTWIQFLYGSKHISSRLTLSKVM